MSHTPSDPETNRDLPPCRTASAATLWDHVRPDAEGLVPCVTQDLRTRAVLMLAWVSQEALTQTFETGWATYYSRSRRTLWEKGATSGNRQRIVDVRLDCDGDTLLYLVEAILPACHEGVDTCFSYRSLGDGWRREPVELREGASAGVMEALETVIDARARQGPGGRPSYTRQLLDAGRTRQIEKIDEESRELTEALAEQEDPRVIAETADLLYHVAVGLRGRNLSFRPVFDELARRFGTSGLEEKARRTREVSTETDRPD